MEHFSDSLSELFQRYYNNIASKEEKEALMQLLRQQVSDEELTAVLRKEWDAVSLSETYFSSATGKQLLKGIIEKRTTSRLHFLTTRWFRYAAAVIIIFGSVAYFLRPERSRSVSLSGAERAERSRMDRSNRATLTLADGSTILLDNAQNGNLAQQGNTKIIKLNAGQLAYNPEGNTLSGAEGYNTVSTPRGGQYQIILPDGSKVWLNAMSSLRFPTAFTGSVRKVEVTGEAYMEIAPSSGERSRTTLRTGVSKPFLVKAGGTEIQVLGTSFNINAYRDEHTVKATLVEGIIKVKTIKDELLLKPGEQAQISEIEKINLVGSSGTNIEQALAWKNGLFQFNQTSLDEAMRQLSRWYDVDVIYEGDIPDLELGGRMKRDLTLSQALEGFAEMGLKYRIQGRKLIISGR